MDLLFDTNALLWLLGGDDRLGSTARSEIERADALAVSVASLWEISIKVSLRKLAPIPGLLAAVRTLGFNRLPLTDAHLDVLQELPYHHRDPFDRMLISQAISERLGIVTADARFSHYAVTVVDARA